ncbi:hypothetical protein F0562_008906 [Nyssa sinensis]|uniref:Uncharacterized protein n=1 Tax=Nyssa sinensis TaxID=561372 RepID=A0A5J5A9G4_9ASTE|nr:hypothetical protein F0562_008906 [Nyssa sinensis]
MAKNRNKKKRNGLAAMDTTSDPTVADLPQAMDTSESAAQNLSLGVSNRKMKKGVQMKKSQNVRKKKAIAKAISQNDKSLEKILKNESKTTRTQYAKKLYD